MVITVRFGELWLRGRNRGLYINALRKNLLLLLKNEKFVLEKDYDRFIIRLKKGSRVEALRYGLSHLFGISGYEISYATKPDLASICKTARELLKKSGKVRTLKIHAHRSYKKFRFNSIDITKRLIKVAEGLGIEPELHNYGSEIFVNVTKEAAFVSLEKVKGPGGLPVGTSGKGVVLFSGGIDSPVAVWYAMKRGVEPVYVHVHGFPNAGQARDSKVPAIIKTLASYCPGGKTYYIPSHFFQVSAMRSGRYELILLKAFMLKLADMVAKREGAEAIFTGESLGQVASQTISNLQAEQQGIKTQILRPLIGLDKEEIITIARRIGTYEDSIKPYKDVCSINARNPATRTDAKLMARLLKEFKVDSLAKKSLKAAEIVE